MQIYHLFPNEACRGDIRWNLSSYCGPMLIRAEDEIKARLMAGMACERAATNGETPNSPISPWAASEGLVYCEKYLGEDYQADGVAKVLQPIDLEEEVRQLHSSLARQSGMVSADVEEDVYSV